MDRRHLLRTAAALAAGRFLAAPRQGEAAAARLDHDPFRLGVASGEPALDGFVLWTRVMDLTGDAVVGYDLAEDEGFRRIVRTGRTVARASRAGAVHLEVAGLNPGRPYFYRFHLGPAVSRTGRTATVPAGPNRLRLALTSCQHWEQGWFAAYRDIIAGEPDAVLQVGDYIYDASFGDGPDVRSFGASPPTSLADYRARHALYRTDPELAAAHAALPFVVTFDDHEVENDYAGETSGRPGDPAAFLRRRAAAYQAYFEHMPLRPSALRPDGGVRLYRRLAWPGLATLHVLDTRQYRSPHPCATPDERGGRIVEACAAAVLPTGDMLGRAQGAWLDNSLAHETAPWSLIVQQTLFSRLFLPQGDQARYSDVWDGYEASRGRVLTALGRPSVRNAVILGGDVHSFWLNDVLEDFGAPAARPVASEIVTSCLAARNGPEALFGPAKRLNPHVRLLDNAHAGYVRLELTRERMQVELRSVRNLADPLSACDRLASAQVEAGRPGFQL